MDKAHCFRLGFVSKVHGLKGKLEVIKEKGIPERATEMLKSGDPLFIEIDTQLVPFFIQSVISRNNRLLLHLDGINSPEQALMLKNSAVYLPLDLLSGTKETPSLDFHQLIGFRVTDKSRGEIGTLKSVLEFPRQSLLLIINSSGSEILLPATHEFIVEIDTENKHLEILSPDGLIDIYIK